MLRVRAAIFGVVMGVVMVLGSSVRADAADVDAKTHPWAFSSQESLESRHPPPEGFTRTDVAPGSFGSFLRTLPLLPEGARLVDYRGIPLYKDGRHPNVASIVDLDVGDRDRQQCADSIVRLHAEWRYGKGDVDLGYRSAAGVPLSYRRYLRGERVVAHGKSIATATLARARDNDHTALRAWLDEVFDWANTAALEQEGTHVEFSGVLPGDFFVMKGAPFGHAVLVLDVARDASGRTALLLGQGFMPAQSFHVLRTTAGSAWFVVEPGSLFVATPFWAPFPMSSLRRWPS